MTLPLSGPISISMINVELGKPANTVSSLLSADFRALAGIPTGPVSLSNFYGKSASTAVRKGFTAGGSGAGPTFYAEIDGLNFDTEAAINPSAALAQARDAPSAFNSEVRGYARSGWPGSGSNYSMEIDGIQFDTEAAINPGASATVGIWIPASTNSSTRGYSMGGTNWSAVTNDILGFTFSSETVTDPAAGLALARTSGAGASSSTRGYVMGGSPALYPYSATAEIDGIQFSTETTINPAASLPAQIDSGTNGNSSTKGYTFGGTNTSGSYFKTITGLVFSSETMANPGSSLALGRVTCASYTSSTKNYIVAGMTSASAYTNDIEGFNYSTETVTNPAATAVLARSGLVGFQSYGNAP